ncbi:MAG: glycosyltransferase, partial [Nitrososphaerota archaeon]|nr:glycosyltransferase [Nitrososphaerota archaeon]
MIPTYNEADNITRVVERIQSVRDKLPLECRLLIVDDNSSDGTAEKVKLLQSRYDNITLLQRPSPLGIGSAYTDGFSYAISNFSADYLGEIDADLQHPPEVLIEMSNIAHSGKDVVIASRYVAWGGAKDWSLGRRTI